MPMGDEAGIAYGSVYMGQRAVEGETIGPPWFASKKAVVGWCCVHKMKQLFGLPSTNLPKMYWVL